MLMCFAHVFEILRPDPLEGIERFSHLGLRRKLQVSRVAEFFIFIPRVDEL